MNNIFYYKKKNDLHNFYGFGVESDVELCFTDNYDLVKDKYIYIIEMYESYYNIYNVKEKNTYNLYINKELTIIENKIWYNANLINDFTIIIDSTFPGDSLNLFLFKNSNQNLLELPTINIKGSSIITNGHNLIRTDANINLNVKDVSFIENSAHCKPMISIEFDEDIENENIINEYNIYPKYNFYNCGSTSRYISGTRVSNSVFTKCGIINHRNSDYEFNNYFIGNGFTGDHTTNCVFNKCIINLYKIYINKNRVLTGGGFVGDYASNCIFNNCQLNVPGIIGFNGGFVGKGSKHCVFNDCLVGTSISDLNIPVGIELIQGIGGFLGSNCRNCNFNNCKFEGTITFNYSGGFAGEKCSNCNFFNCRSSGNEIINNNLSPPHNYRNTPGLIHGDMCGGFVGRESENLNFNFCDSHFKIFGTQSGGFCGNLAKGIFNIDNSSSKCIINDDNSNAGFFGGQLSISNLNITNSYFWNNNNIFPKNIIANEILFNTLKKNTPIPIPIINLNNCYWKGKYCNLFNYFPKMEITLNNIYFVDNNFETSEASKYLNNNLLIWNTSNIPWTLKKYSPKTNVPIPSQSPSFIKSELKLYENFIEPNNKDKTNSNLFLLTTFLIFIIIIYLLLKYENKK